MAAAAPRCYARFVRQRAEQSMPPETIRPLIVPSAYLAAGGFPAPHIRLAAPDLAVTCVLLSEPGAVLYVQPEIAEEWRIAGTDWLVTAVERMRQADKGLVWTYERRDDAGQLL